MENVPSGSCGVSVTVTQAPGHGSSDNLSSVVESSVSGMMALAGPDSAEDVVDACGRVTCAFASINLRPRPKQRVRFNLPSHELEVRDVQQCRLITSPGRVRRLTGLHAEQKVLDNDPLKQLFEGDIENEVPDMTIQDQISEFERSLTTSSRKRKVGGADDLSPGFKPSYCSSPIKRSRLDECHYNRFDMCAASPIPRADSDDEGLVQLTQDQDDSDDGFRAPNNTLECLQSESSTMTSDGESFDCELNSQVISPEDVPLDVLNTAMIKGETDESQDEELMELMGSSGNASFENATDYQL